MSTPLDPTPLPERETLVRRLRETEGLTLEQIGEKIGRSRERVRQILRKVRLKLKVFLAAPPGSLIVFPLDLRWDLQQLGFQNLQEVQLSLELGNLHWNPELEQVRWRGRAVGEPGRGTWEALHHHMGLPCPGESVSEEPRTRRL